MPAPRPLTELSVDDLLRGVADGSGAPAGAVAALSVAAAAALVTRVARASTEVWDDAPGIAAQSEALRARAAPLAQRDVDAYAQAVALLGAPTDQAGRPRNGELAVRLRDAAAVPAQIAAAAADVAELAEQAAHAGLPAFRVDAQMAAALARAAAAGAQLLVGANLAVAGDEDPLLGAASRAAGQAERAWSAAVAPDG